MIDRGPHPSVVTLDIYVNDSFLTTTSGDGLLISTPSGSTAYALSGNNTIKIFNYIIIILAGGPIMHN